MTHITQSEATPEPEGLALLKAVTNRFLKRIYNELADDKTLPDYHLFGKTAPVATLEALAGLYNTFDQIEKTQTAAATYMPVCEDDIELMRTLARHTKQRQRKKQQLIES